jgi:hypothetical protein
MWSEIIKGGSDIFNNLLRRWNDKKNNEETLAANKELAAYQFSKDVEMWNMQNAYNTPSAQRGRLEEAGYNPALMYGSGSIANTATQAPKYSEVRHNAAKSALQLPDVMSNYNDLRIKDAQANLLEEQSALTTEKVQSENILQDLTDKKAQKLGIDLNYADEMAQYNVEGKKKSNELLDKKIATEIEKKILQIGDQKLKEQVLKNKKAEGYNIWLRNQYQAAVNSLVDEGIMPTDNLIVRQIAKNMKNLKEFTLSIGDKYKEYKKSKSVYKGAPVKKVKGR